VYEHLPQFLGEEEESMISVVCRLPVFVLDLSNCVRIVGKLVNQTQLLNPYKRLFHIFSSFLNYHEIAIPTYSIPSSQVAITLVNILSKCFFKIPQQRTGNHLVLLKNKSRVWSRFRFQRETRQCPVFVGFNVPW
jgi:hypothetical protein